MILYKNKKQQFTNNFGSHRLIVHKFKKLIKVDKIYLKIK